MSGYSDIDMAIQEAKQHEDQPLTGGMKHFDKGQTKMNQDFKKGTLESFEQGPTKSGKYGPYANFKLHVNGEKFNYPFVSLDKSIPFQEGDEVAFMYEEKEFTTNDGKNIKYKEVDYKTFKAAKTNNQQAASNGHAQKDVQKHQVQFSGEDNRQVLIVAQSSLERALTLSIHNNAETKVDPDAVITLMKKFANAVLQFKPLDVQEVNGQRFVEDECPF